MSTICSRGLALALILSLPALGFAAAPKGLGDPGQLTGVRIEPNLEGKGVTLRGRDARQHDHRIEDQGQMHLAVMAGNPARIRFAAAEKIDALAQAEMVPAGQIPDIAAEQAIFSKTRSGGGVSWR
jgi:hypothetical protein